jgi:hypothetical protein
MFAGNINHGRRADGPFEMAVDLGFGETVVLCVETFHAGLVFE